MTARPPRPTYKCAKIDQCQAELRRRPPRKETLDERPDCGIVAGTGSRRAEPEEAVEEAYDVRVKQRPSFIERYCQDCVCDVHADAGEREERRLRPGHGAAVSLDERLGEGGQPATSVNEPKRA